MIDEVTTSLRKISLQKEVRGLCVTRDVLRTLYSDFKEEFRDEYGEMGLTPTKEDMFEYFKIPLIVSKLNGKKYKILTSL